MILLLSFVRSSSWFLNMSRYTCLKSILNTVERHTSLPSFNGGKCSQARFLTPKSNATKSFLIDWIILEFLGATSLNRPDKIQKSIMIS